MCKVEFQEIQKLDLDKNVIEKVKVEKPVVNSQDSGPDNILAENCYKCNRGDRDDALLVCDQCDFNVCHYDCDGLPRIPRGKWYC